MEEAIRASLRRFYDFCKKNMPATIETENYGTINMWEIGLLIIPEDDENTAVMQYFMQQFKTFT